MTPANNAPANDNTRRPASFDAAVLQWRPFLHKMARKLESRAQDREELVQETIATALHRWASYREGCSLPAWLVFQMRERCHAMRRKNRPLLTILPEATPATQEDHVIAAQALASVKPKYLRTMTMVAAGFNQHEIAAAEGVTHQAIHQRVNAVRKRWAA